MTDQSQTGATRKFLFVSGIFIIAVGLFYGAPKAVIESSFGITIDGNSLHIFRAIMGLYCGIGFMVLLGAANREYSRFSLILETVFFGGVGIGRLISFALDGNINTVAVGAAAFELVLFLICLVALKAPRKENAA